MGKNSLTFFMVIAATLALRGIAAAQTKPPANNLGNTINKRSRPKCDLGGAVADDRDERVIVTVWHNDMERRLVEMMAESFSNGDGVFEFDDLPWFAAHEWARHRVLIVARSPSRIGITEVSGANFATNNVYIEMKAKVDLRGRLLDRDSRKPIANGWIWPSGFGFKHAQTNAPLLPWHARTDARGSFVLRGVPAGYAITCVAGGANHARTTTLMRDLGKSIDVQLPPGGRIRGRVLMPGGTPAKRVRVVAVSNNGGWGQAQTDHQGQFELVSLKPGTFAVWATAPELTTIAATNLHVRPRQVVDKQSVQLVKGGFIVGRLVDAKTGKPIVPDNHMAIALHGPSRGPNGDTYPVFPDGTFRIRAPAGENRIELRTTLPYEEPSEVVTVAEGQESEVQWNLVIPGQGR